MEVELCLVIHSGIGKFCLLLKVSEGVVLMRRELHTRYAVVCELLWVRLSRCVSSRRKTVTLLQCVSSA